MLKVLHYVGTMNRAGAETFIMNMFRSVDRSQVMFDFLCTQRQRGDYDEEIKALGGNLFYIDLSSKDGLLRHLDNYRIIKRELRQYVGSYDVIHIHTYHALDMFVPSKAALEAGFKQVVSHSHSNSADGHFVLHKIFRFFLSLLPIKKVACSVEAWKWMFSRGKCYIVRNGIYADNYKFSSVVRRNVRDKFRLGDEIVLGHVGRFDPVKNHMFLVRLFAEFQKKYPSSKLLLVGKGIESDRVKEECSKLNIQHNVIFAGLRDDVNEVLQAMDVFVFPSKYEGLGIAVIEAESTGLPCVVSDRVPNDVDLGYVKHLSLNESFSKWIEEIECAMSTDIDRFIEYKRIIDANYDIKINSKSLVKVYED